MFLLRNRSSKHRLVRLRSLPHQQSLVSPSRPFLLATLTIILTVAGSSWFAIFQNFGNTTTTTTTTTTMKPHSVESMQLPNTTDKIALLVQIKSSNLNPTDRNSPYHDWELFASDFEDMMNHFKIYVYPDVSANESSSPFAGIFLPHPNPFNPKLGNYFSEHMFKLALLRSSLTTDNPKETNFFFMPFSINNLRNDPRVHSEEAIIEFVSQYAVRISRELGFWNASGGADHFYICCHSVGREAALKHQQLKNNAIQVTCSSSYFQRLYVAHKDIGLPQIWPRPPEEVLNSPNARHRLAFFSGRIQNSRIRQELIDLWGNDTDMDIYSQNPSFPYAEGFRQSKYCLHVKGYEVNTARISDAIHFGCIPVIISNYYDLPFASVLDWRKFSVIISREDISSLKTRLLSISSDMYLAMYSNLSKVREHFMWHTTPRGYDSFYMTVYQLWQRRGMNL